MPENGPFFAAYIIWLFSSVSSITYIRIDLFDFSVLYYIVPFLLLANEILFHKWDKRSLAFFLLLVLLNLLQLLFGGSEMLAITMFIFCSRNIDFDQIARLTLIALAITTSLVVSLSLSGIITNGIAYRGYGGETRRLLGFIASPYATYFLLTITALTLYIRRSAVTYWEIFLFIALDTFVYLQTTTRAGFILTLLLCAGGILEKRSLIPAPNSKLTRTLLSSIYIACSCLAVLLVVAYDPSHDLMERMNGILSYRLSFTNQAIYDYGFSLLGQDIDWRSLPYIVDISYIRIALDYGLITLFLSLIVLTYLCWRALASSDMVLYLILFVYALHFFIDPTMLTLYLNPFMILGVQTLYKLTPEKKQSIGARNERLREFENG